MVFKAVRAAAVIGALTWMATNKDKLPDLPPSSLGLPVQAGLPFAHQGAPPSLSDLTPAVIPGLLAQIQGATANASVPDLGPFTAGRAAPPRATAPRTLADQWRDAPEDTRRRIATLLAHRGSRMLLAAQN